jgi:hypothetical protein
MKIFKLLFSISLLYASAAFSFAETRIRVGHFPNITRAAAAINSILFVSAIDFLRRISAITPKWNGSR